MLRSSFRLLYITRTNLLVRASPSSLSRLPSKFSSAKPLVSSHHQIPLSTTGAKLSRSEHSMAASSEPKSIYDFTVKVRYFSFLSGCELNRGSKNWKACELMTGCEGKRCWSKHLQGEGSLDCQRCFSVVNLRVIQ